MFVEQFVNNLAESSSDDDGNTSHLKMLEEMAYAKEKLRRAMKRRKLGKNVSVEELEKRKDAFVNARDSLSKSIAKNQVELTSSSSSSSSETEDDSDGLDEVFSEKKSSSKSSTPLPTPKTTPKKMSPDLVKAIKDDLQNGINKIKANESRRKEEKRSKEVERQKGKAKAKLEKSRKDSSNSVINNNSDIIEDHNTSKPNNEDLDKTLPKNNEPMET